MVIYIKRTDSVIIIIELFVPKPSSTKLAMDGTPREVFLRAEELTEMGLNIPEVTQVFLRLKQMGLPVEPVYTLEQAVEALTKLRGGMAHA